MPVTRRSFLVLAVLGALLPSTVPAAESAPDLAEIGRRWRCDRASGRFKEKKFVGGFSKPVVSEGRFEAERGRSVRWITEKPRASSLTFEPGGIRYEDAESQSSLPAAGLPANSDYGAYLAGILLGDFDFFADDWRIGVTEDRGVVTVTLLPKPGTMPGASQIEIRGRNRIESAVITLPTGEREELILKHVSRS
jgi:hypothetical protein